MTLARNTADLSALLTAQSPDVSMSGTVKGGSSFSLRNKLINGNFDIWQRSTSQTASGYVSVDRWSNSNVGTTKTASRQTFTLGQTDVPNNPKYWLRHVVSSVAGASNFCRSTQHVEDVTLLSGKIVTLSFWAKADVSRNLAVEFTQNFGTGGSPSALATGIGVTTFALTTSWQKFTTTVTIPSVAGKTLGTNNNNSTALVFWFDAGSSFNSNTNSLGQQSGTFDIAQVQLEEGSIATPFEIRPQQIELALCQRYFQSVRGLNYAGYNAAGGGSVITVSLSVSMRAVPTKTNIGSWTTSNATTGSSNGGLLSKDTYILYAVVTATGGWQIAASSSTGFDFDAEI